MCVCLVGTLSSPTPIAKFSLRESCHQSQNSHYGLDPSGLQIGGNVRVRDWGHMVAGATLSHQILCWLLETTNSCEAKFMKCFQSSVSILILALKFIVVSPPGIGAGRIPLAQSQKTLIMTAH